MDISTTPQFPGTQSLVTGALLLMVISAAVGTTWLVGVAAIMVGSLCLYLQDEVWNRRDAATRPTVSIIIGAIFLLAGTATVLLHVVQSYTPCCHA